MDSPLIFNETKSSLHTCTSFCWSMILFLLVCAFVSIYNINSSCVCCSLSVFPCSKYVKAVKKCITQFVNPHVFSVSQTTTLSICFYLSKKVIELTRKIQKLPPNNKCIPWYNNLKGVEDIFYRSKLLHRAARGIKNTWTCTINVPLFVFKCLRDHCP